MLEGQLALDLAQHNIARCADFIALYYGYPIFIFILNPEYSSRFITVFRPVFAI